MNATGQNLYARARKLIPGGTQLLSKRPEMFLPEQWPAYYERAKGCETWDLDGRRYVDVSHNGVGSMPLGFGDPEVDAAVLEAVRRGNMATLNCPDEVALAEKLIELHPWAEMVRYARSGGEIMTMAARIARAATGRSKIAFCGYHGWHDWYLAANLGDNEALDDNLLPGLSTAGVPKGLRGTVFPFAYNRPDELEAIVVEHGSELAAIIMEPARNLGPQDGFLANVRELANKSGAVLVFDEVTSGWRLNTGGVHLVYGVMPDLAAFAKGMGNGYPMAALIGRGAVMSAAEHTFISSTYWTDHIGPSAALAMIRKHQRENVGKHLVRIGERVQTGWRQAAAAAGLALKVYGLPPLAGFSFDTSRPEVEATYFIQEMLQRGYLASTQFYATYAHDFEVVDSYLKNVDEVFRRIAEARNGAGCLPLLRGPVKHTGFKRLN
jgi:glutamate-1-semialdehyde 2,1-aminomutase